jgi:hypothetical protein
MYEEEKATAPWDGIPWNSLWSVFLLPLLFFFIHFSLYTLKCWMLKFLGSFDILLVLCWHWTVIFVFYFHLVIFCSHFVWLMQEHKDTKSSVPFLLLNEKKKLVLLPLHFLHEEASVIATSTNWREGPCVSTQLDFPMNEWVHVGCEVWNMWFSLFYTNWSSIVQCFKL